tara:strand:+ start:11 stop:379 length:369 start_codon:yes stop_codon:yes gene_type:complete
MSDSDATIEIDKMSIDQAAGAFVMIAGAIGSLLLVIWQSKCHCRMNLCYIFQCERRPPSEDEMKSLKEQSKKLSKKQDKTLKKEDEILTKEEEILQKTRSPRTPQAMAMEPEPEPEMESIIP